jgi:hypothetical protein
LLEGIALWGELKPLLTQDAPVAAQLSPPGHPVQLDFTR